MGIGNTFLVMLGCTFFVIFEGTKALLSILLYLTRAHETEQIFNSRVFEKEEIVREKLAGYFHGLEQKVKTVNLSFAFAYVMISLMLHMIAPGSPIRESFGVVFVFYLCPLLVGLLLSHEIRLLKIEMAEKFNAQ